MIEVVHTQAVKESFGQDSVAALTALFKSTAGTPPSVAADRFRADNVRWLDILDDLEYQKGLIERGRDGKCYSLRCYALPLVEDEKADRLLELMQEMYFRLKGLYPERLSENLSLKIILDDIHGDYEEKLEALFYLSEGHDVWSGKTIDFPYAENSTLVISESVLRHRDYMEVLGQYFEWHFINPKNEATNFHQILSSDKKGMVGGFFVHDGDPTIPEWYDHLDDVKKALIGEIDIAMRNSLSMLPTIGLRTLIETVMVEKIGDHGSFKEKLDRFHENGYATKRQVESLSKVLDAGNASAHRAYFPNEEDIRTCVEVAKHLLHGIYILDPKVSKLASNTPQRASK